MSGTEFELLREAIRDAQRKYDDASEQHEFQTALSRMSLADAAGILCAMLGKVYQKGPQLHRLVLRFLNIILHDEPRADYDSMVPEESPESEYGVELYNASLHSATRVSETLCRRARVEQP